MAGGLTQWIVQYFLRFTILGIADLISDVPIFRLRAGAFQRITTGSWLSRGGFFGASKLHLTPG